jgi:microcystin-dependent protein
MMPMNSTRRVSFELHDRVGIGVRFARPYGSPKFGVRLNHATACREEDMQDSRTLARQLMTGISVLAMIGGVGTGMGALALVTATPAAACNTEPYLGTICTFAMDWCPRGYLLADGRTLPISTNTALFGVLGFAYGGDNVANFAIPDLRGRVPVGKGQGPGLNTVNITQKFGQQQLLLNASQVPVPPHTHPATFQGTGGGSQTVNVPANSGTLGVTAKLLAKQAQGQASATSTFFLGQGGAGPLQAPIYVPAATVATTGELGGLDVQLTGAAGNGAISFAVPTGITGGTVTVNPNGLVAAVASVSTQPPSLGMSVCIAVEGIYPSRP